MLGPFYKERSATDVLGLLQDAKMWKKFCPTQNKTKPYSMAFYVATRNVFLTKYMAMTPQDRMFCETLPDDVPLKVYMDVEFKRADAPGVDMDECVQRIQKCVADLLSMPTLVPFQLDASNGEKASRHLTWPVSLKNKEAVKALVQHAVRMLKKQGAPATGETTCGIDLGVYDKNRGMRLCYSHKLKEFERKLLPYPDKTVDARMAMEQSMIAHFVEDVAMVQWTRPVLVNEDGKKTTARKKAAATGARTATTKRAKVSTAAAAAADTPLDDVLLAVVKQRLSACYPGSCVDGEKMFDQDTLSLALRPGIVCPVAKRVHQSNCTWMNVSVKTRIGEWMCSDPDCKVGKRKVTWGCVQF